MDTQRSLSNIFDEKKSSQISSVIKEFDDNFMPKIIQATQEWWENEYDFRAFCVSNYEQIKDNRFLRGETFFTSQVPDSICNPVTIRLSEEFARIFLHNAFGSNRGEFRLVDLSELEIKILNGFCDFVYKSFADLLIPSKDLNKFDLKKHKEVVNFIIVIKDKDEKTSKIVLTLPYVRINKKEFEKTENFSDESFKTLSVNVDIEAGSSKITLSDLQSMSLGDIILLESSNVNKMKIKTGEDMMDFKVNPDPSLVIELDEDEHDIDREENTNKNMWDDIQIEVNAQFKKVKMTLGELKHISKGLVIDLGSIFNNEISLLVENKTVAKGELVIINDKYAVKINKVISDNQDAAKGPAQKLKAAAQNAQAPQAQKAPAQKAPAQKAPAPQKPAAQKPAPQKQEDLEEDFDYSDFEEEK